jgi:hypothetical protein
MKLINCAQLSSAWFQAHCGVVTASSMAALLSLSKERVLKSGEVRGGEPLAKRKAYLDRKIGELLTGIVVQDNYVSKEMMEWASIHLHKDFYIETVYSNSESKLAFATADETELVDDDTEDSESPDEGEDEPELDPDAEQDIPFETEPVAGSGPRELKAYRLNHNTD